MDGRSGGGSRRGRDGRENAGMSNAKRGGIPLRRKPEVSRVKAICPGVSRPLSRGRTGRAARLRGAEANPRAELSREGVPLRGDEARAAVVPGNSL